MPSFWRRPKAKSCLRAFESLKRPARSKSTCIGGLASKLWDHKRSMVGGDRWLNSFLLISKRLFMAQPPAFLPKTFGICGSFIWNIKIIQISNRLLEKLAGGKTFYLEATREMGWTRKVLELQIGAQAYEHQILENKTHNFEKALPAHSPPLKSEPPAKSTVSDWYHALCISAQLEH